MSVIQIYLSALQQIDFEVFRSFYNADVSPLNEDQSYLPKQIFVLDSWICADKRCDLLENPIVPIIKSESNFSTNGRNRRSRQITRRGHSIIPSYQIYQNDIFAASSAGFNLHSRWKVDCHMVVNFKLWGLPSPYGDSPPTYGDPPPHLPTIMR